ncbi:C-Myc-binding protein [Ictalurus punctatus]|uniref:c-Myc-binding protein n=1 Tax=Ictalurus punctatus TaxID=7998 RepID=E3TFE1_ICTPU|nr:C-Myc-binding protein [Ictalurus punctatus]XP_053497947.1 C-Myc-binding protein isoform X2 [Ictalurus furcatus]ADO29027.1 c-myc-binding protein [Ictalurus punctatus]
MAHYRASESKREQFRRYLEKAGVLDSLTNVLVALYEETEKPSNALDFIKQHLSAGDLDSSQAEVLRVELEELQHKYDLLQEENRELRNRLLQYEPAAEDAGAE